MSCELMQLINRIFIIQRDVHLALKFSIISEFFTRKAQFRFQTLQISHKTCPSEIKVYQHTKNSQKVF